MPRLKTPENGRQIYATVREDLYLAAKTRATELRMPLRRFIEHALELALSDHAETPPGPGPGGSPTWEDEYLEMQARQPIGSPVELTEDEAEWVIRAAFPSENPTGSN